MPKIKLVCKRCGDTVIIDPYRSAKFRQIWELEHLLEHSNLFAEEVIGQ